MTPESKSASAKTERKGGAPVGNRNALRHGIFTREAIERRRSDRLIARMTQDSEL